MVPRLLRGRRAGVGAAIGRDERGEQGEDDDEDDHGDGKEVGCCAQNISCRRGALIDKRDARHHPG